MKTTLKKESNYSNNNKICVYAICKNERQFVEKWLDNVSEADYIVVLDTGSTDGTYEFLQNDPRVTKVKQKIYDNFRFDEARNDSMKLCPKDANILFCTDFDELLNPGWAAMIKLNWKENTNRGYYTYAWDHNEKGEPRNIFKYDKMHDRNYHWIYPVHEVLSPIDKENYRENALDFGENIYLHHWQDKSKPRKFYFDLLELSCKENPDDTHARMLLAREYLIKGEKEKAIEEFLTVLSMPDVDKPNKRLVLLNSLMQLAFIYEDIKNYDECIWYCQEFIKEDKTYREPYFLMGEVYNLMKMPSLAEACIKAGFEYGKQKYDWVERGNTWLGWGYDLLSVASYNLGKIDEAIKYGEVALQHEPNDTRLLTNQNIYLKTKIKEFEKDNSKNLEKTGE